MIYFHTKIYVKFLEKTLLQSVFFTHHLKPQKKQKQKQKQKKTQLADALSKSLPTVSTSLGTFQPFWWFYEALRISKFKYFWSNSNALNATSRQKLQKKVLNTRIWRDKILTASVHRLHNQLKFYSYNALN